jgi:homoserine kinase
VYGRAALVETAARCAMMVKAITRRDLALLEASMKDVVHVPFRRKLIPHYDAAERAALQAGAACFSISGSGPSVFAVCALAEEAQDVVNAVVEAFEHGGLAAEGRATAPGGGVQRLED